MLARKTSKDDATETANKASDPSTNNGRKQEGERPNRFSPSAYEEDEEYVVLRRQRQGRREENLVDICEICLAGITNDASAGICAKCFRNAHYTCHGVPAGDQQEFLCVPCSESTSRKGKRKLRFEDDTFEDNAFDPAFLDPG